uniref:Uncharacterized protein n=1 Tax=Rhizophora mucronata TaxID=61149 RepID=A0A2P2INX5_RHIMU
MPKQSDENKVVSKIWRLRFCIWDSMSFLGF